MKWRTQNGEYLEIEKMTDEHLLNILNGGFAAYHEFDAIYAEATRRKLDTTYAKEAPEDPYDDEESVTGRHPFGN